MKKELVSQEWFSVLEEDFNQPYFKDLLKDLSKEYGLFKVYPSPKDVFRLLKETDPSKVRVVIIGQDPYPFGDHADGLAFSSKQQETPASLRTILREVDRDVIRTENYREFKQIFPTNDLSSWLSQGVFPINMNLTVRAGTPGSHNNLGWERFTGKIIEYLWKQQSPKKVFIAWGEEAKKGLYSNIEDSSNHHVLTAGHPATASHGKDLFSGCSHFSKVNHYFYKIKEEPINWKLSD